jgi:hypothetical protein
MYELTLMFIDDINALKTAVSGENFRKLLGECFSRADRFSLTVGPWYYQTNALWREIHPYLLNHRTTSAWFAYGEGSHPCVRLLFPTNAETRALLEKYFDNMWLKPPEGEAKQSLEDLCFFQNGKLFFGTVSHEYICSVAPPDEEFMPALYALSPLWRKSPDPWPEMYLKDYGMG